ncbi:Cysteine/O-acetylserine efflux protein [Fervidicola ferrireducens]|uniref:Cysteine/O-acetylserine efflux protein n=1 Tax=Fervidicola ferrireducens TaxID=520764 RepID=A0A140L815_9FIRM|nr:LysE family transporter [Fervidicola ferrireducens]KXG76690.1 Cysteine/O-acetylserine efflux protein [Fervidicola ferrireducens]
MPNFIAFLSYALINTFTPGPNNILSMTFATNMGFKKTFRFILGVAIGFTVVMMLCNYFNLFLFYAVPLAGEIMKIFGAIYIIYLAVKILKSNPDENNSIMEKSSSFAAGLLLQFFNPKVILYGITVTSSFITPYYKSSLVIIMFSLFLAFLSFLSTCSWALFGAAFQRFLKRYKNAFNALMALLLLYSAFSILAS